MASEKVSMIVGAFAVSHKMALQLHKPMEDEEVDVLADVDTCSCCSCSVNYVCNTFRTKHVEHLSCSLN